MDGKGRNVKKALVEKPVMEAVAVAVMAATTVNAMEAASAVDAAASIMTNLAAVEAVAAAAVPKKAANDVCIVTYVSFFVSQSSTAERTPNRDEQRQLIINLK